MKLKNILTALAAGIVVLTSCVKEDEMLLSEVRVSSSYVSIPTDGGSYKIKIDANAAWTIETDKAADAWLTVAPLIGESGVTEVTFSAAATSSSLSTTVRLICAGQVQLINVQQQADKVELPISSSKEVNAAEDGTVWKVKGTVRGIENTTYGNYYIDDADGSVYVYGTLNNGEEKKFAELGIEAGDIITVQGPKTSYNGNPQMKNVDVIAIEKSLIKVEECDPEDAFIAKAGGEVAVTLTVKGESVNVVIPEAAKSWLSVEGLSFDGEKAVVMLSAPANEFGDRSCTVTFVTTSRGKEYTAITDIYQEGSIIVATAAEINAAEAGPTQYRITGVVSRIASTKYGNLYIKDATGEVYVYGTNDFADSGIQEGDIVTVTGPKAWHGTTPEMLNVTVDNRIEVKDIAVADFRELPNDKTAYYRLCGTVTQSDEDGTKFDLVWGNFALTDETGSVYVYGVRPGWGGEKKDFGTLDVKEGDTITIICYKTSYNGLVEADGCVYVSHESAGTVDPEPADGIVITDAKLPASYPTEEATFTEGGYTYYILNVANYGNGIQMKKDGSYIANKTAFNPIKTITLNVAEGRTWYPDNVVLYAGSEEQPGEKVIAPVTGESGNVYDLSDGDYTYFKLVNTSGYAVYCGKIVIEEK